MAALSTLALLSLSASVAKTGVQVASSIGRSRELRRAAHLAEQQGDYEAMLFGRNATLATRQADDALARGEEAVGGVVREARQVRGGQRAAFAAQGIDINSGSPADVQANDSAVAALDMQRIRTNAAREAAGFTTEAETYRLQASWARTGGLNTAKGLKRQSLGPLFEIPFTLASGFTGASEGWKAYRKAKEKEDQAKKGTPAGGKNTGFLKQPGTMLSGASQLASLWQSAPRMRARWVA